ncbi:MAG: DUF1028 domain-containing protein [candidate division Zixibacteria bacterium]|nr:DUF1028 domain-containing protein [candidate division Zixibacteria bacterium]MDH3938651.1 DUF1028 domain-containing protein [candidate division Zixibacteria bacterium]MDH4032835.1 DUF1028 domain-containing protein [candidate division Zixibacteria bacterium]
MIPRVATVAATLLLLLLVVTSAPVQATFSIVAVDTITGEVGGAGASCIAGSQIINDIIESVGAVHTQAWYQSGNQNNAHDLLAEGQTPDSILQWLYANDIQDRPEWRQYGVVTLAGAGASAGFTGVATDPWRGHITGPGYSIQGNILLSQQIIDSMEYEFLNTEGPLEEKLMAALEAAKVPGADTRCLPNNKSAISAFIRVVRPGDGGTTYLYEVINNTSGTTEPIDLLRVAYDAWKLLKQADADSSTVQATPLVIEANGSDTALVTVTPFNNEGNPPSDGVSSVSTANSGSGSIQAGAQDNGDGSFSAVLTASTTTGLDTITATVEAAGQFVALNQPPVVTYYRCGDLDGSLTETVDIADLVYVVDYMFNAGPPPPILEASDIDGSGGPLDIADLVYVVDYMFNGGPLPLCN